MVEVSNLRVHGREFTYTGPHFVGETRRNPYYLLTGPNGAAYLAMLAFAGDEHTFRVLTGRRIITPLRIQGNAVWLTDESGELRQADR